MENIGVLPCLFLLEISPLALIFDHVALESLWITHICGIDSKLYLYFLR